MRSLLLRFQREWPMPLALMHTTSYHVHFRGHALARPRTRPHPEVHPQRPSNCHAKDTRVRRGPGLHGRVTPLTNTQAGRCNHDFRPFVFFKVKPLEYRPFVLACAWLSLRVARTKSVSGVRAKLLVRLDVVAAAQLLARGCQEDLVLLHHLDAYRVQVGHRIVQ